MTIYYSPAGNAEVWDRRPSGYLTEDEWRRAQGIVDDGGGGGAAVETPVEQVNAADVKAKVRARYHELALQAAGWEAHGFKAAETAVRSEMRQLAFEYVKLLAAEAADGTR